MNPGFFPFQQKPSPLFRAGHERFFSLVQHEDHAFSFGNALTGRVTRFLRSVSPRECWTPALRDSSPPREPFRPCPLGCLHPRVPEPGTEEAFRGGSSCLSPTERLSPPTLVNPSLPNILSSSVLQDGVVDLFRFFNPFSNDINSHGPSNTDNGTGNCRITLIAGKPIHKCPVYFDNADRKTHKKVRRDEEGKVQMPDGLSCHPRMKLFSCGRRTGE